MDQTPSINIRLSQFAPRTWFSDQQKSTFWLRMYTCLGVPHAQFPQALRPIFEQGQDGSVSPRSGHQVLIACCNVNGIKVPVSTWRIGSEPSGATKVMFKIDSEALLSTPYVFLSTPFKVDGIAGDEHETRTFLDEIASLLCLHFGHNFMWHIAFEGEIEAATDEIHVTGKAIKMPQVADGPFLSAELSSAFYEITAALRQDSSDDRRRRILLALQLIDRAMRTNFGFLDYWTAIEVVCGGKEARIAAALGKIYSIKNLNKAKEATRLNVIAKWRHDLVHRGLRPLISADVERYLQFLLLDLMRHELGLEPRYYTAAMEASELFDLEPLGIKHAAKGSKSRLRRRKSGAGVDYEDR